ncbi:MAG: hypothetical protein EHM28_06695 [Spirochaetaceae bacterium]|nr:MAG: hypothetical protein EHM28_06695 [Spirochaetaceae bacterium]
MGWDVAIYGTVAAKAQELAAWMKSKPEYPKKMPADYPYTRMDLKTVDAVMNKLKSQATLFDMAAEKTGWSVRAVLDGGYHVQIGLDLAAAFNAAQALGLKAELVTYGWITAGPGMAYRFASGKTFSAKKLTDAEEKKLKATKQVRELEQWIEDELAAQEKSRRPKTNGNEAG